MHFILVPGQWWGIYSLVPMRKSSPWWQEFLLFINASVLYFSSNVFRQKILIIWNTIKYLFHNRPTEKFCHKIGIRSFWSLGYVSLGQVITEFIFYLFVHSLIHLLMGIKKCLGSPHSYAYVKKHVKWKVK